MTQIHHYSHPTTPAGPGTDTVIDQAVQIDPEFRLGAAAAVGDVSIVGLTVDDPDAAYDFHGLWRWYVIEDACPPDDHYAFNGYIGPQTISRGDGSGTLFPVGAGRRHALELRELSHLASRRVIWDTDGNRPAETVAARLTWLIGTVYLPVTDNGLITYDTTALDANDYRGQKPADVLNDMANRVGYNWWLYYDQAAADGDEISLAFFDPDSGLYMSDASITNVEGAADGELVLAPWEGAELERDPDTIAAGAYTAYTGGSRYDHNDDTENAFALQDQVAPTASIKTDAAAAALNARFLVDNADQNQTAHITVTVTAANLNAIKHGHRLNVTMTHWPGWEAGIPCRVTRKTFGYPDNKDQTHYDVELELQPVKSVGFHQLVLSGRYGVPVSANGTYPVEWRGSDTGGITVETPSVIQDTDGYTGTAGDMQWSAGTITEWTIPTGLGGRYRVAWETFAHGPIGMTQPPDTWWWVAGTSPGPNPQQVPYVYGGEDNGCGDQLANDGASVRYDLLRNGVSVASTISVAVGTGLFGFTALQHLDPADVWLVAGDVLSMTITYAGPCYCNATYASYGITTFGGQQGVFVMTRVSA